MSNAKEEFINKTKWLDVLCALIRKELDYNDDTMEYEIISYKLKKWYTKDEYDEFLKKLSFEYDSWYWWQNLFGNVWFKDWTRLERWEYDWSEWREHKKCPEIPDELLTP